jgi:glycosyltransferase involved in cell wall biosynthesis
MHMTERPRVLLLIPHLGGGGAEQVVALLARGLSPEKYELHLGLATQARTAPDAMPSWVRVHAMGASRVRSAGFKLLQLVRRIRPDVILSGMFHLNFLVLLLRPFFPRGTFVLVRQNGTVSAALAFGNLPGYTRLLYRMLYRRADRVICQTQAMAKDLADGLGIAEGRLAILPNPVDIEGIRATVKDNPAPWTEPPSSAPGPHLLAVGRLSREKGFDLLLQALAVVRQQFPLADLAIIGSGPEEAPLKALCRDLGLESNVRFAGHVDQPATYFREASAFVLSSRHEGLPNALLEAAAGGVPIVALPASEGVCDLLRDQPGAWLAPEVSSEALAASLLAALEVLRPGDRIAHPFIEEFRMARAIDAYEGLIETVLIGTRIDTPSLDLNIQERQP